MAWENRLRGGHYYIRKHRINGKIVNEYVGSGASAELVAQMDRLTRLEEASQRGEQITCESVKPKCLATPQPDSPAAEMTSKQPYDVVPATQCTAAQHWRPKRLLKRKLRRD